LQLIPSEYFCCFPSISSILAYLANKAIFSFSSGEVTYLLDILANAQHPGGIEVSAESEIV